MRGLGSSYMATEYGLWGLGEAEAYLSHSLLGPRLLTVSEAVLSLIGRSALQVFGTPDDLKLCSCATLFAQVAEADPVFEGILEGFFAGEECDLTLQLLAASG